MASRVTQGVVEVLSAGRSNARQTQLVSEVIRGGNPRAIVTQQVAEVLRPNRVNAGLTQQVAEVLRPNRVNVGLTQAVSEVLRSTRTAYLTQEIIEVLGATTTPLGVLLTQDVVEVVRQSKVFGSGPGNGGERFPLQLAPSGTAVTATLDAALTGAGDGLLLTGDAGLPSSGWFCLTIDDEVIYLTRTSPGVYHIDRRGLSNTAIAAHSAGATATWTDTYLMAVRSANDIAKHFIYPVDGLTYDAWLICFDSSQARLGGDRYPAHVAELAGVFAPHDATNKLDGGQLTARHTPTGVSDNCPAALTIPARLDADVQTGDVALLRYTNAEASILTLTSRAAAVQSWYAFSRRDAFNNDVTLTDPAGTVVDASINVEAHDVPDTTTTMPGTDRTYTYGPPYFSNKGWPLAALAVRQDQLRIPHWRSPDWHNFSYVYPGFFDDATYVQVLINRNGYTYAGIVEEDVSFPTPLDTTGPNATWDDSSYYFGSSWYVAIFAGATLFVGPSLSGESVPAPPSIIPVVRPGGAGSGGGSPGFDPPGEPSLEGGDGGDIDPPPASGHDRFWVALV